MGIILDTSSNKAPFIEKNAVGAAFHWLIVIRDVTELHDAQRAIRNDKK
jgi:hypothetical protein